ncbi:MAG: serine protease Do [Solirubrobacteraceae bacterium]|nr:serine protease Do [Solirubrobacteraceae bacterium]
MGQPAEPVPAQETPRPRPARKPTSRAATARPRRRIRVSKGEMRRWAVAGGVALIAAFITASAVALIVRGDSQPTGGAVSAPQTAGPGHIGAPNVASPATGGAWIGVEMRSRPTGEALISAVVHGSPAEAAGLFPGDVILGVDNTSVTSSADVIAVLSRLRPGQVVPVSASRGAARFTAQVTLAARPRGHAVP